MKCNKQDSLVLIRPVKSTERIVHAIVNTLKAKVKLSLCVTKHNAMKTYWIVEV